MGLTLPNTAQLVRATPCETPLPPILLCRFLILGMLLHLDAHVTPIPVIPTLQFREFLLLLFEGVFPCWPKTKIPKTDSCVYDSSTDPNQVQGWFGNRGLAPVCNDLTTVSNPYLRRQCARYQAISQRA